MGNWIQGKCTDLPIHNFTTDWNDGRAIGALVDACGPGLCPDWADWAPKNKLKNAKEAMDAAEKWLDVPQLIKPAEMVNPKVDEMSMMTYLSQFPNCKLNPAAPIECVPTVLVLSQQVTPRGPRHRSPWRPSVQV